MMKFKLLTAFCLSGTALATAGSKLLLGTPVAMLKGLEAENTAETRAYTLVTSSAERLRVHAEDFYFVNGELSMTGRAIESRNSDFILKGDAGGIYGWVVLKDRNVAYEYTTDATGAVQVEEVPVDKIYPVCELENGEPAGMPPGSHPPFAPAAEDHVKPYAGQDLYKLQSLPGAKKVLWLDIVDVMNADTPILFVKEEMYKTWQVFASSFSMFDVNVTTDKAVYTAAGVPNSGIAKLLNVRGRSNCGINAFGTTRYCNVQTQAPPMTHYQYGKTAAHETGHLMGLRHDGSPAGDYFGGFSTYQWSTIMGNNLCCRTWTDPAIQWSKGEYANANNTQDDFAVITGKLPFRADDISAAVPLKLEGDSVPPLANRGQIAGAADVDQFSFAIGASGGSVRLRIERTEIKGGAALDIDAKILDGTGKQVAQNNPVGVRSAAFNQNLPAGNYTLAIAGGAEGTPANGFSSYASMGFYAIAGRITGGTVGIAGKPGAAPLLLSPLDGNGRLRLGLPLGAKVERIVLYSAEGSQVFQSRSRVESIDMAGQAAGNYLLTLAIDGMTVNRKVIKR